MGTCRYCKRGLLPAHRDRGRVMALSPTRDHIIARSRGGHRTVPCCYQCNQLKADLTLIQWARFMQAHPQWWILFRMPWQVKRALERLGAPCPVIVPTPPICRGLA